VISLCIEADFRIADPAERGRLIVPLQSPPPTLESTATVAVFNLVLRRAD
jgi:hypothetical protein